MLRNREAAVRPGSIAGLHGEADVLASRWHWRDDDAAFNPSVWLGINLVAERGDG